MSFIKRNLVGWKRYLCWRLGIKRPFVAAINNRVFEVRKDIDIARLTDYIETLMSDLVEEEVNGLEVFKVRWRDRELLLYSYPESKRDVRNLINEVFRNEMYGVFQTNGKDVLDVGANIGDSTIYFALNGANRVIALEPYPAAFKLAKKNVEANHLESNVILLNEGAGDPALITVDETAITDSVAILEASARGRQIRVSSLDELVERFPLSNAVLKVDCEGCEYPLILNSTDNALARFSFIVLEYHWGSKQIKRKLRKAGFRVRIAFNHFYYTKGASNPREEVGMIIATR